ncbi:MAG: hypothetical protein KKA67_04465 [Spirochaetes bacterium]|nr:hypothetical protein [Spirochaetota bacterium]MBU1080092.1 hypothetical protein [Spirochaetota bacterium]
MKRIQAKPSPLPGALVLIAALAPLTPAAVSAEGPPDGLSLLRQPGWASSLSEDASGKLTISRSTSRGGAEPIRSTAAVTLYVQAASGATILSEDAYKEGRAVWLLAGGSSSIVLHNTLSVDMSPMKEARASFYKNLDGIRWYLTGRRPDSTTSLPDLESAWQGLLNKVAAALAPESDALSIAGQDADTDPEGPVSTLLALRALTAGPEAPNATSCPIPTQATLGSIQAWYVKLDDRELWFRFEAPHLLLKEASSDPRTKASSIRAYRWIIFPSGAMPSLVLIQYKDPERNINHSIQIGLTQVERGRIPEWLFTVSGIKTRMFER